MTGSVAVGRQTPKVLTSNSMSNSYLIISWMYQHLPNHLVPCSFESSVNQSLSFSLFFFTYCTRQGGDQ